MKILIISGVLFFIGLYVKAQQFHDSFFEDFNNSTSEYFRHGTGGIGADFTWTYGVDSPSEAGTKILSLKIDPNDNASPWQGPNLSSNNFTHFGTYSMRIKIPDVKEIQPDVGAVVGFFTYTMHNQLGISEIDFEWLIADPEIIYIGAWTGQDGDLKRIGRTINLAKGIIYNSNYRELKTGITTSLTGIQNQPETIPEIEDYNASSQFYTYGFDWYPDRLKWWLVHPETSEKIVLWDYQGELAQERIPQHPSRYLINFWHTNDWPVHTNPRSIEKPDYPFETEIDWASYNAWDTTYTNTNTSFTELSNVYQIYPNPFNKETTIQYSLKDASHVSLVIYNMYGEKVVVLLNEQRPAGIHTLYFNASDMLPGVYLCRIQSKDLRATIKVLLTN